MYEFEKIKRPISLTVPEIRAIEKEYKANFQHAEGFSGLFSDEQQGKLETLLSGRWIVEQQLESGLALQPGILFESSICQTIAEELGLNMCLPAKEFQATEHPCSGLKEIEDARYVFFSNNSENLVLHCGSPDMPDCLIVFEGRTLFVEIKDFPARLFDTDLLYSEEGKLIIPKQLAKNISKEKREEFDEIFKDFNSKSDIFSHLGKNIHIPLSSEQISLLIRDFLSSNGVNYLAGSNRGRLEMLSLESVANSLTGFVEIRPVGKNYRTRPFCPEFVQSILERKCQKRGDSYIVRKEDIDAVKGRGQTKISRLKLAPNVFVPVRDARKLPDGSFEFSQDSIRQSKAGISVNIYRKKAIVA